MACSLGSQSIKSEGPKIKLNYASVSDVCGESNQVMVYGFGHCKYLHLINELAKGKGQIKKVFECSIGNDSTLPGLKLDKKYLTTLEGREIQQLKCEEPWYDFDDEKIQNEKFCTRSCKTGTIDLVLENYKRILDDLPIIPIIFSVDITDNPFPFDPKRVSSKEPSLNCLVTHSEMRRCYKLVTDENLTDEIREVSLRMIRCIKLNLGADEEYTLTKIEPFWNHPEWECAWKERMETKSTRIKKHPWRELLKNSFKIAKERHFRS
jgi:hypothetical protein